MILHLSHSAGAVDGGIATAVAGLVEAQRLEGASAGWITADQHPAWRRDLLLRDQVLHLAPDLVHLHGLWRSPTRIAPALARKGLPLLIAPHGMLDPWALAYSRRRKAVVWRLWERRALEAASCLQALCPAEAEAIRALGISTPIAVIPNGVNLPDPSRGPLPPPPWSGIVPPGEKVLLFLGRFHAKKGLRPLLTAWAAIEEEALRAGWWLVLVGYGDGGATASAVAAAGLQRCRVYGPCFGEHKEACLSASSAFVLPSFSEGLPMAALEAMSRGLPCLLSPECHLEEAVIAGAALSVRPEVKELRNGIRRLFAIGEPERMQRGKAGRQMVISHYSWNVMVSRIAELHRWLLIGGLSPAFMELGERCVEGAA
ncbi:glycosyltransferase [Synechococcus sp. Cruz-9H2]|uniref:glycosyltransferase n=1 Tax=unclassified Synechococcus TaxID=2626047 RepID=UPI0020CE6666|nr:MULTISPECIES: glycosyltransferase [unclassified Synechococcus]MCP9820650.1 glycosyltransferase [Synechococcus sp. Cruz-9H2]MCP9844840.1 glycosyltransferase [Synechococcus sp. Edmonson 11F2]MCP9856962.1 glycosyltransferase [Synechococcus sp. Cruz-9C9]MCP9864248.1 glycosyltransferase [Synechococcus sp. Cruz-7E5]MCP9871517.1 glycosyltransferase [Synechococcus sp. Cruz-7B9]